MKSKICGRCRGILISPGTELEVTSGEAWSSHSRRLVLCSDCGHDLAGWLQTPPRTHGLEPHGAIGSTVDSLAGAMS